WRARGSRWPRHPTSHARSSTARTSSPATRTSAACSSPTAGAPPAPTSASCRLISPVPWRRSRRTGRGPSTGGRARRRSSPPRVPVGALLAPPRLAALRSALSALHPTAQNTALDPDHGTAHVSVVDAEGNAAAITTTINTGFGAGILVSGTGVILNNEMDDFALAPGMPNVYGLVGTAANALGPGKRPQSSMSPTVVLEGRRPALVVGGSGGPTIISGTLQVVLGVTAFGLPLREAVEAPRLHDQAAPPVLAVEAGVEPSVRTVLERLGHHVVVTPMIGAVSAAGLARH